jgi:hypothetical protein
MRNTSCLLDLEKTFEMEELFCFVILITGFRRPNSGRNDDDDLFNWNIV